MKGEFMAEQQPIGRLRQSHVGVVGQALVRMIQMIAMIEHVRCDPARPEHQQAFPQKEAQQARRVMFEGAARVSQVDRGVGKWQLPGTLGFI